MPEFCFSPERRGRLSKQFARKHDPDRAEFFVSTSEREIVAWLKAWPVDSWNPSEETANALERIRVKAGELLQAIERLDSAAALLLFPLRVREAGRATSPGDALEERQAMKAGIMRIRDEAESVEDLMRCAELAHEWHDGPITRRADQDLCDRFARAYIAAFHALPPASPGSIFPAFCEEAAQAIADHPGAPPVRISRRIIEHARRRTAVHLDYLG